MPPIAVGVKIDAAISGGENEGDLDSGGGSEGVGGDDPVEARATGP